jgi:hypothetical protein
VAKNGPRLSSAAARDVRSSLAYGYGCGIGCALVTFRVLSISINCSSLAPVLFIFLMKSETEAVHACVYLADDIVFTKNGPGLVQPWTLTALKDVQAFYAQDVLRVEDPLLLFS